jgi:hypothetical protein
MEPGAKRTAGAFGTWEEAVAACRRIVDEHLPMALIVEDDITFIDGVAATLLEAPIPPGR